MKAEFIFILDKETEARLSLLIRNIVHSEMETFLASYNAENELSENEVKPLDMQGVLALKISDIPFSTRIKSCLRGSKIYTIADLISLTRIRVWQCRNLGKNSLYEIDSFLHKHRLDYDTDVRAYGYIPHKESRYNQ